MISVADCSLVIGQLMSEPQAGLLSGILYGTKATLSPEFTQDLITTGTIHMVALSGTNIAIVMTILGKTISHLVPRQPLTILVIICIGLFVWWVGPTPSIVRAAIMGSIGCLAVLFGRKKLGVLSWLLACSSMVIFSPPTITSLSFQLSALSSLGLILCDARGDFGPNLVHEGESAIQSGDQICEEESVTPGFVLPFLSDPFRRIAEPVISGVLLFIREELRTTLAAQAFTIPLVFFVFGRVSLIAPITNLAVGWVIPIVTSLGFIMVFLGFVFLPAAMPLAWLISVLLSYLMYIVSLTANLPFASIGR